MSFVFQLLSRNIGKHLINCPALLWPLVAAGDPPPGVTFSVATSDPDMARAAVAAGARAVLIPVEGDFAPADRMAVALSVTEADLGLADGALALIIEIAGPAAALRLGRGLPASPRLAAIGIDLDGFGRGAAGAVDGPRLVAAGLVALAGAALGLPAYLTGADSLTPSGAPAVAGFSHRLVDADGKARSAVR
ncbi:hypothetical protein [Pleomorphomonas carboxyditropha]|uniref:HpcH/HpaI aldolase/citrate lyase domain-containing protein n=1 Tax=Pleomorphomonas carboxyditropha TaxID=2023338 RepID=A0A2G9WQW7_9HYPH|nr:hypothetical protein [Pleomorphomonas carboxyditropha]PIO97111.1 hypothetical protein CJ014_21820 [Pleomorphomonas carboxyditropha]